MSFEYTIKNGFNHIIEEKGNSYMALRRICWCSEEEAKDKEGSLDLRRYYLDNEGNERMYKGKGISFTDEGAGELARVLVSNNFGDTKDIINGIKNRENFMPSLVSCLNNEDLESAGIDPSTYSKEDYYDPRTDLFEGDADEE